MSLIRIIAVRVRGRLNLPYGLCLNLEQNQQASLSPLQLGSLFLKDEAPAEPNLHGVRKLTVITDCCDSSLTSLVSILSTVRS